MALRKFFGLVLVVILCASLHVFLSGKVWEQRQAVRRCAETGYVFPSKFGRVMAFGHKGLYADYLLLNTITFYGERAMNNQQLSKEDWDYLVASLDAVTDLDPYFLDPYVLAEGTLTWGVRRIEDANRILAKGVKHRTWDWQLPYFLGFNYFYFQKDYVKGSEYLMQASRLPGSPSYLPKLAARLGFYGDKTKTALLFLKGMVLETQDEALKKSLQKRETALERAAWIEERIDKFKAEQLRPPNNLNELIFFGYIDSFPEEPYGGQWVIMPNGRVFSTSKFVEARQQKGQEKSPAIKNQ